MKWTIIILLLCTHFAKAQDQCIVGTINTDRVGNGNQFIAFETDFIISRDSIIMTNGVDSLANIFRILESRCSWQMDTITGQSRYEVELKKNNRKAIIQIIMNPDRKVIELNYQGSKESRVFPISGFSLASG